jgi:hypothetical protein
VEDTKMKKYLALFFITLACLSAAAAEDKKVIFDRFPDALGFYGDVSGLAGLSYQCWRERLGFQTSLSAMVSGEVTSVGGIVEGKYRLYADDYAPWLSGALYLAALGGYRYSSATGFSEHEGILGGLGLGFEVSLFQHFSLDLQILYRAAYHDSFKLNLMPGFGLAYRF